MKPNYSHVFAGFLAVLILVFSGCEPECDDPAAAASLATLQGNWIRIESNNPIADFVKVTVVDDEATITDKATSNFAVGDIKWRLIKPSTHDEFTYEELGSDGNYYAATLTLVTNDEVTIMVSNSGAGNSQKWVRDDGSIGPSGNDTPTVLDCNFFNQDRTLVNTESGVDYIVTCVMDITTNVIIEAGVVIEFEENGGLGVYDQGTLSMVGTSTDPIILRGKEQLAGYWRGIHMETNSVSNRLEYVTIQHAGSNYVYCCNEPASLLVKDGKVVLQNSTLSNGGGYGVIIGVTAEMPDFENNTITSHTQAPLKLGLTQTQYLDAASDFSGNSVDFAEVTSQNITVATTIPALTIPYLLEGKVIDITATCTISAGAELVFEENGGLGIYDSGSIQLMGTAAEEVRLRGKQAITGFWRGIHIETNTLNNVIKYANISEAGGNYVYCCNEFATIFLKGTGKLQLQHTTLSRGASYGLYASSDAELLEYGDNTITTHAETPLYIAAERADELDGMGSDYSGNQKDYIGIFDSNIANPTTWPKTNVPYLIDSKVIDITEAFTIEPGAEIVFQDNGGLGVYDNGSINALGTNDKRIVLRGLNPVPGAWRGIHVETNSLENEFQYVSLQHAASNYVYCCNTKAGLFLKNGQMTVANSSILDNAGCGIFVGTATLNESGNTFFNNTGGDICQ